MVITTLLTVSMVVKKLYNYLKGWKERREYERIMEDPLEVKFFIPPLWQYEIGYVEQDVESHFIDVLEVPEEFEDVIFLRIQLKVDLKVRDCYFGFLIKEKRKKPEIFYSSAFIKETTFERKWSKDWYGHLHFPRERFWYKDEQYISALKIKTYDKGDYPFFMYSALSCNEYKSIKEEKRTRLKKKLKLKVKRKDT